MVRDVFDKKAISRLVGSMGIGHVRYPTAGSSAHAEAQPFYVNSPYGIVFAHNGNLTNTRELKQYLDVDAHRHINTDSDSELLLNIFANNLQKTGKFRINEEDIFTAIKDLMHECKGGYACVAMLAGFGIIAFRDPCGIRPVGMAVRDISGSKEKDYLFASESVVADAAGFTHWEDVRAGEAIIITRTSVSRKVLVPDKTFAPDIFEWVYFARPDSVLDGVSVYRSRMAMGDLLAEEVRKVLEAKQIEVDVVIPVPDTSRVAALNLAQKLGLPYREGFVKNRYVDRTFIMPGQQMRRKNVRRKLNAMALEFSGKSVLIVDDSIVRGTTSKEIIQMAKDVGARNVIFASCAPPIRYCNVYGIDMPSRQDLVAYHRTPSQIADALGADLVIYQTLQDLVNSVQQFNPKLRNFDCSVFTGEYVTGDINEPYLAWIEASRSEKLRLGETPSSGVTLPAGSTLTNSIRPNGTIGNLTATMKMLSVEEEEEAMRKRELMASCSGPMNGADDIIGLHNTFKVGSM
ncbi:amidophosphoribosyltransferase [Serendipita sp. 411]|nr:amidophosphoribosyltransferase [Serendipita sp. 411]